MKGKFVRASDSKHVSLDWGENYWFSTPEVTGAQSLVVVEVTLFPGFGHSFHKHPRQEEVIYVLDGEVEQWLETEKQILKPGDSVFIGADVVHASFNSSESPVKLMAILGPSIGEEGYEVVEVFDEAPWNTLRS
jgi:quercetin dioxygenase-like cupin family protein